MEIGGSTRVFALLGDPVAHSLSPVMQNAAFRALGIDAVYVPLQCAGPAVAGLIETLTRQGGGGNVTVPHKAAAAQAVQALGGPPLSVCNTFWSRDGTVTGAETDSDGILAALTGLGGPGGDWCLVGTGGSARAALRAARRAGVRVAVRSRSPERAQRFLAEAQEEGVRTTQPEACQVVLNCTPRGLADGDPLPIPIDQIPPGAVALDLVYRRGETPWVRALRQAGRVAQDGRVVLVGQGAASFAHWFPRLDPPLEVMRAAVRSALE